MGEIEKLRAAITWNGPVTVYGIDLRTALDRLERAEKALREIDQQTKAAKNARQLVGPREYAGKPALFEAWAKGQYHAGKAIHAIVRDHFAAPDAPLTGGGEED